MVESQVLLTYELKSKLPADQNSLGRIQGWSIKSTDNIQLMYKSYT